MILKTSEEIASERRIEAVKSVIEWSKQIITLATGTLVVSGTFIKDIFSNDVSWKGTILTCWIMMCISTLFGIIYLGTVSSLLSNTKEELDIMALPGRIIALIQVSTFIIGLTAFAAFIAINL